MSQKKKERKIPFPTECRRIKFRHFTRECVLLGFPTSTFPHPPPPPQKDKDLLFSREFPGDSLPHVAPSRTGFFFAVFVPFFYWWEPSAAWRGTPSNHHPAITAGVGGAGGRRMFMVLSGRRKPVAKQVSPKGCVTLNKTELKNWE